MSNNYSVVGVGGGDQVRSTATSRAAAGAAGAVGGLHRPFEDQHHSPTIMHHTGHPASLMLHQHHQLTAAAAAAAAAAGYDGPCTSHLIHQHHNEPLITTPRLVRRRLSSETGAMTSAMTSSAGMTSTDDDDDDDDLQAVDTTNNATSVISHGMGVTRRSTIHSGPKRIIAVHQLVKSSVSFSLFVFLLLSYQLDSFCMRDKTEKFLKCARKFT